MSDHLLSQEEIDALLKGAAAGVAEPAGDEPERLADLFRRALLRLGTVLPSLAGRPVHSPSVDGRWTAWGDLRRQVSGPLVGRWDYSGAVQGVQVTLVDGAARALLPVLAPAEDAVTFLNKLSLALLTALEQELGVSLGAEGTGFHELDLNKPESVPIRDDEMCVSLHLRLRGDAGEFSWFEVLPADVAQELAQLAEQAPAAAQVSTPAAPAPQPPPPPAAAAPAGPVAVTPAQFAPLRPQATTAQPGNIGLILDVPLQVTVELGRRRMLIRDVLELGKGSLIELDKLAGEPVDVFVNGKLIAKGEVVVIDENFGVKITSIVSPVERVQNLQ